MDKIPFKVDEDPVNEEEKESALMKVFNSTLKGKVTVDKKVEPTIQKEEEN